jgi:hypothetical protein
LKAIRNKIVVDKIGPQEVDVEDLSKTPSGVTLPTSPIATPLLWYSLGKVFWGFRTYSGNPQPFR